MKSAKLFKNGQSQAVRLPKEFRFEGSKVYITKMGRSVVLIPAQDSWETLVDACDTFTEDFMINRDQPSIQQREGIEE